LMSVAARLDAHTSQGESMTGVPVAPGAGVAVVPGRNAERPVVSASSRRPDPCSAP
jgi:hypothetical protein